MVIPDTFGTRGEKKIVSYDYYDIVEGTGTKVFYGFGMTDSSGEGYGMSGNVLYADPQTETASVTAPSTTGSKTVCFDLGAFNTPKTIDGILYIEGSMATTTGAGATGVSGNVAFTLQHFDGDSTYTTIGTVTTETISSGGGATTTRSFLIKATLTKTHFKKGESLRMRGIISVSKTSDQGGTLHLACDPKNRDISPFTAATNHTSLNFHIPFKLNL